MSVLISYYHADRERNINQQNISNVMYNVSENIRIYLDDLARLSLAPNVHPDIMSFFKQFNEENPEPNFENYRILANYRMIMQRMLTLARQDIRGVTFIPYNNPNGRIYTIDTRIGGLMVTDNHSYMDMPWYEEVIVRNGAFLFAAYSTMDNYPLVNPLTGVPLRDTQGFFSVMRLVVSDNFRQNLGVIIVDASSDVIEEIFTNIKTSERSGLLLLDGNNDVVYSTKNHLEELAQYIEKTGQVISSGSDNFISYIQPISGTDWQLIYLSSQLDSTIQNRNIFAMTMISTVLCLLAAFIIFHIFSNRIASHVNDIITTKYQAVISQRNAEYMALQAQISPHFFYNTLNGFVTLNRLGEKNILEDSIIQLTELFRYTCENEQMSTIGKELEFVDQYLKLQQLRFDDRLKFSIDAEPSIHTIPLPRLLIQPLVENAVIHGMEPFDTPFSLAINVSTTKQAFGEFILISVIDNGAGFNENDLKHSERVGLVSVSERLSYYDEKSIFSIRSKPGKGTACHMVIRKDVQGNENFNSR